MGKPLDASHEPERQPDGDPIDGAIADALDRLEQRRARGRDPVTKRFTIGNGGRLETGLRSQAFMESLEPARLEIEQRVRVQLGLTNDDAPETALGLAGAYAEARLIRRSEFLQLTRLEDTPANPKARKRQHERRRRHLTAWSMAFDRELKAALALGLERKAKPIPTPAEYWAQRTKDGQS